MNIKDMCIQYRNLKVAKELGIELGTLHNVVSLTQNKWLGPYSLHNNNLRTKANNDF